MGNPKTTGGNQETPNRDAALEELAKSAVVNAVEPVTTKLGELQHRLDAIADHITENTIAKHDTMLQDRLKPIDDHLHTVQAEILGHINQRLDPLNDNFNTLQNQVLDVDKHVDRLSRSVQSTHDDVRAVGSSQTRLAAETLVRASQLFNTGCGLGLSRRFEVIPFVTHDAVEWPDAFNLPPLRDVHAINSLNDDELQLYLAGYNINHESLDRAGKLHRLKTHIGCIDDGSVSILPTVMVMGLLVAALLILFPDTVL